MSECGIVNIYIFDCVILYQVKLITFFTYHIGIEAGIEAGIWIRWHIIWYMIVCGIWKIIVAVADTTAAAAMAPVFWTIACKEAIIDTWILFMLFDTLI